MTTAELMAVAVLKGDMLAARALADHLTGELADGVPVEPVKAIRVSGSRVKAVLFGPPGDFAEGETRMAVASVRDWLESPAPYTLVLPHGCRVELYELAPEQGK